SVKIVARHSSTEPSRMEGSVTPAGACMPTGFLGCGPFSSARVARMSRPVTAMHARSRWASNQRTPPWYPRAPQPLPFGERPVRVCEGAGEGYLHTPMSVPPTHRIRFVDSDSIGSIAYSPDSKEIFVALNVETVDLWRIALEHSRITFGTVGLALGFVGFVMF